MGLVGREDQKSRETLSLNQQFRVLHTNASHIDMAAPNKSPHECDSSNFLANTTPNPYENFVRYILPVRPKLVIAQVNAPAPLIALFVHCTLQFAFRAYSRAYSRACCPSVKRVQDFPAAVVDAAHSSLLTAPGQHEQEFERQRQQQQQQQQQPRRRSSPPRVSSAPADGRPMEVAALNKYTTPNPF